MSNISQFFPEILHTRTVALNIDKIAAVADDLANVDAVGASIANVNTVAATASDIAALVAVKANVIAVAGDLTNINLVATSVANVNAVALDLTNINTVRADLTNIDLVAGNRTNVTTVAGAIANVNAVGTAIANVSAVAGGLTNINTVKADLANIDIVAGDIASVRTVAADKTNIDLVAGAKTNVDTVATNVANVNTLAGGMSTITLVAADKTNIDAVAGSITQVDAVAADLTTINTVATKLTVIDAVNTNQSNINTVAGAATNISTIVADKANIDALATDLANVNTVAASKANVDIVAGSIADVSTVATNMANVTSVKNNSGNITIVALDKTNIDAVAGGLANVNTVATNLTNVTWVANNISDINKVAADTISIDAVAGDLTNINKVAADLTTIDTVAGKLTTIDAVNSNQTNINNVAGISLNVSNVSAIRNDVVTVSTKATDVSTVANKIADVSSVVTNLATVQSVSGNMGSIIAVNNNLSNLTKLVNDQTNIDALATDLAAVNAVAADLPIIDAVNADRTNIDTVGQNISAVLLAASNMLSIQGASGAAASASAALSSALSVYGSADALNQAQLIAAGFAGSALAAQQLAQGYAASASSVVQQDLSGVTGLALHRSPNAIVAQLPYDTSRDSDGGAWTDKTSHTSWYNEPLNGTWLSGPFQGFGSEIEARDWFGTAQGTATSLITGDDSNFTNGVGAWTAGSSSAIAGGNGKLRLTLTGTIGTAPVAYRILTTVVGQRYRVDFTRVTAPSGVNTFVGAGTGAGSNNLAAITLTSNTIGPATISFVATGTTTYLNYVGSTLWPQNTFAEMTAITVRPVSFATNPSSAYYQLNTDGKFYRLWKNLLRSSNVLTGTGWTFGNASGTATQVGNVLTFGASATDRIIASGVGTVPAGAQLIGSALLSGAGTIRLIGFDGLGNTMATTTVTLTGTPTWYTVPYTATAGGAGACIGIYNNVAASPGASFTVADTALEYGTTSTAAIAPEVKGADASQTEVFRGNTAKFPRLSAIIAEASNITIYDLTQPGRPMWLRFRSGVANTYFVTSGPAITGIAMREGELFITQSATYGLVRINFASEQAWLYQAGGRRGLVGNIAGRNGSITLDANVDANKAIANSAGNAVSATTLPDAPIDPLTGLQVPTIAVGTGGGVSIVKHDGNVFSGPVASITFVDITPQIIAYKATSSGVFYTPNPGSLGAGWASTNVLQGSPPSFAGDATRFTTMNLSRLANRGLWLCGQPTVPGTGNGSRMGGLRLNEGASASSLAFGISSDHNTGWMTGDIRRCWLADTVAGDITCPELVTTPGFDTSTGWTLSSQGTGPIATISGGQLTTPNTDPSNFGYATQTIATVVGQAYEVTVVAFAGAAVQVRVGTVPQGTNLVNSSATAATTSRFEFVASTTSSYLMLLSNQTGAASNVDSVSIKAVIADRTNKNKPISVYGTLTRTAVAAAAQLMFYSGWSATNYAQEPYSADFDFGTGPWRVGAWVNIPAVLPMANFPVVGGELCTNGGFTDASSWTPGTGVTISGGVATFSNVASGIGLQQTIGSIVTGKTYLVQFDVSGFSFGSVSVRIGSSGAFSVSGSANGTYQLACTATGTNLSVLSSGNGGTFAVDNVSVKEVGIACLFDRSAATGAYIKCGLVATGQLAVEAYDGTTTRRALSGANYNTAVSLKASYEYSTSGTLSVAVNGITNGTPTTGTPLLTLNNATAVTTLGNARTLDAPFPGSIALLKPTATLPTQDQKTFMYGQEQFMFQPGAQCCLTDASAIDFDYDPTLDRIKVISGTNESSWTGLARVSSAPVAAGTFSKVSHRSGAKILARVTTNPGVDVSLPAYGLKEELVNRAERAAKLARLVQSLDYVGGFTANVTINTSQLVTVSPSLYTGSTVYPGQATVLGAVFTGTGVPANTSLQYISGTTIAYMSANGTATNSGVQCAFTDFILPVGYEAVDVMVNGAIKQEGATKDWIRLFDGFRETIRFAVAPGYTAWVRINARRTA